MDQQIRPTKKQRELLSFLEGFIAGHGYGPSYRETMRALEYKSVSTVAAHIDNLIARGWVTKRSHSARSIEVTASEEYTTTASTSQPHDEIMKVAHRLLKSTSPQAHESLNTLIAALRLIGREADAKQLEEKLKGAKK